jgi:hypothetical protein
MNTTTYQQFKDNLSEKFCAVVNGVGGLISSGCGDLEIKRSDDGSIYLSKRAAALLTGLLQDDTPVVLE